MVMGWRTTFPYTFKKSSTSLKSTKVISNWSNTPKWDITSSMLRFLEVFFSSNVSPVFLFYSLKFFTNKAKTSTLCKQITLKNFNKLQNLQHHHKNLLTSSDSFSLFYRLYYKDRLKNLVNKG